MFLAMEDIRQGERVREFVVEGRVQGVWKELCRANPSDTNESTSFRPSKFPQFVCM